MTRRVSLAAICSLVVGFSPAALDLPGTVRVGDKPFADAIVWLDAPKQVAIQRQSSPTAVLAQRNMSFFPHVLAVQLGTTVDFPNDDRVFHNVFSDHDGKRFNLGLYPVGTTRPQSFDTLGLSRIFCNIHPQMSAYVMVLDTPYFSVTDAAGHFNIGDLVPGNYTYHAWRPGTPKLLGGIVIATPGAELEIQW
jgi:plastocyanin